MKQVLNTASYGMQLFFKFKQLKINYNKETNKIKKIKIFLNIINTKIKYNFFIRNNLNSIKNIINFLFLINSNNLKITKVFSYNGNKINYTLILTYKKNNAFLYIKYLDIHHHLTTLKLIFDSKKSTLDEVFIELKEKKDNNIKSYYIDFDMLESLDCSIFLLLILRHTIFKLIK